MLVLNTIKTWFGHRSIDLAVRYKKGYLFVEREKRSNAFSQINKKQKQVWTKLPTIYDVLRYQKLGVYVQNGSLQTIQIFVLLLSLSHDQTGWVCLNDGGCPVVVEK